MNWKRFLTNIALMLAGSSRIVMADSGALAHLMRPFEYLDLSRTYDHYSAIIDLIIFLLIFLGAAKVTLGRRFEGKGGQAICAGVGIALAAGMIIAEERLGFNLRSFGPVAALILVALFGIMTYQMLRYAGMSKPHAAAIAFIALFAIILGIAPEFLSWLGNASPLLAGAIFLCLLLAIISAISLLWPFHDRNQLIGKIFNKTMANDPVRKWDREAVRKEAKFIKRRVHPSLKEVSHDADESGDELDHIERTIRKHGKTPEVVKRLIVGLTKAGRHVGKFQDKIRNLRNLTDRLKRFDTTLFSRKSRERLSAITPKDREILAKEMRKEVQKLDIDTKANQAETTLERHVQQMETHLRESAYFLESGQTEKALQSVRAAKSSQNAIQEILNLIQKLEEYLLTLTKNEIRLEKKLLGS